MNLATAITLVWLTAMAGLIGVTTSLTTARTVDADSEHQLHELQRHNRNLRRNCHVDGI